MHLGLIYMLFPNALIIHCIRNPYDTCLSKYFQHFDTEYSYSFDLSNTADFYLKYFDLMEHWKKHLPMRIIDVHYDDMVHNTESITRNILNSLNLEWNAKCLSPHQNERPVKTSSFWQVRQPIYKNSLNRWQNYEHYLKPLKKVLG